MLDSVGKNQHLAFGRRTDDICYEIGQKHKSGLEFGQFVDHISDGHDALRIVDNLQKLRIFGLEFLDLHANFGIRHITLFGFLQNGTQDPFHDKHQSVFAFRCSRESEHLLAGDLRDGLHKHFGSNMVAFIDNHQTNALEGVLREIFHGESLEHGNYDIATFDVDDVPLDATYASPRQETANPIFPLITEERVMNEDKSRYPKL